MKASLRQATVALTGVIAFALGGASFAWACTASPEIGVEGLASTGIQAVPQGSDVAPAAAYGGAPGAPATVKGTTFRTDSPVEIRWNDASGPLLATTSGPEFSVAVAIPEDTPGVHSFVAVQSDLDLGGKTFQRSVPVKVLGPGESLVPLAPKPLGSGSASLSQPATGHSSGATVALGAGLLGLGLVSVCGAFTLVALRRPRALADRR